MLLTNMEPVLYLLNYVIKYRFLAVRTFVLCFS